MNLYSKSKIICRENLSHVSHVFPDIGEGNLELVSCFKGQISCAAVFPSVWHHVMALYCHIAAWKLSAYCILWHSRGFNAPCIDDGIYWLHNAELFSVLKAQSFQCPVGFIMLVNLAFNSSEWIFIQIYLTISPPLQGGWWVAGSPAGKAETSNQGTLHKIQILKSFWWIFIFIPDAFLWFH